MASLADYFNMLDEVKDYINRYGDGKEFEIIRRDCAQTALDFMQFELLPSVYKGDDASSYYAIILRGVAEEACRVHLLSDLVLKDLYFEEVRGEFIVQNVGQYMLDVKTFFAMGLDDVSFKTFLVTLMKGFFGGSTKLNLEKILESYPGPVTDPDTGLSYYPEIFEILLEAVKAGISVDIAKQWMFLIKMARPDLVVDMESYIRDIMFILFTTKPAHTLPFVDFVYVDPDPTDPNIPVEEQSILGKAKDYDREEIFFYEYEDLRKPCISKSLDMIQENITLNFIFADPKKVQLGRRPLVVSDGVLAGITDVVIDTVPPISVNVVSIDPICGEIILDVVPPVGVVVMATYKWQHGLNFQLLINNQKFLLNQGLTETFSNEPYASLINSNQGLIQEPLQIGYKYSAYELPNSALLNESRTLVYNGDRGYGNLLNRYKVFKSKGFDRDEFRTVLGEGTPPFPWSQTRETVGQQPYPLGFILNDLESRMNSLGSKMFDHNSPPLKTSQALSRVDDIFGDIYIERLIVAGEPGKAFPICDTGIQEWAFHFTEEDVYEIQPDKECEKVLLNNMFIGYINTNAVINGASNCAVFIAYKPSELWFDSYGGMNEQDIILIDDSFADTMQPWFNPDVHFMLNVAESITNNLDVDDLMFQENRGSEFDYYIVVETQQLPDPPVVKYLDGSGILRDTPLPFPI